MDLINTNCITRKAEREDSKRIWLVRGYPTARQYSANSEVIPFEKHDFWFEKKYFSNQDNHCFVLEGGNVGKVIGYCRFDFDGDKDCYIASIALDPNYHGRGLGHQLLNESLQEFVITKDILAEIQKSNIPSIKVFQKNNFKTYREDEKNYYLKHSL